jgi:elongation factor Ts
MHIAANLPSPVAVREDDISSDLIAEEKRQLLMSEELANKPEEIQEKIVDGRLVKFVQERALLSQAFVKDPNQTVEEMVKGVVAQVGENIQVNRFVRFELGA